jgi:hypothetical protein
VIVGGSAGRQAPIAVVRPTSATMERAARRRGAVPGIGRATAAVDIIVSSGLNG